MSELRDYLGDGVYARFDGYVIVLYLDGYGPHREIVLEPEVYAALTRFAQRVKKEAQR